MAVEYKPQPITLALLRELSKQDAPPRPREIRDTNATGLVLRHEKRSRVCEKGRLNFYVQLDRRRRARPFGKRCDARLVLQGKPTLETVKREALRLRAAFNDGVNIAAERRAERAIPTLNDYLDNTYEPWAKAELTRGAEAVERIRTCFGDDFGRKRLNEITKAEVSKWKAKRRRQGVKPETINRDVGALRAALNDAVTEFEILKANPLSGVKMSKVDRNKRVVRALTEAEKARLLKALDERDDRKREARASANAWREKRGREPLPPIGRFADALTPAVIVSLETGLRRGELFALEWQQVDLRAKEVHVKGDTTKSYLTRTVPLNARARAAFRDWWLQCGQPKTGHVFSNDGEPIKNLKHSYHAILEAAGTKRVNDKGERVTWHSLRHTFGSLLGAAGVDPETIRDLMGHADLATTQRYLHTDRKRKLEAVERLHG